jgi:hypothetical protein
MTIRTKIALKRVKQNSQPDEEVDQDRRDSEQLLAQTLIVNTVGGMFTANDYDLIVPADFLPYLEELSVEKCKEVLAWYTWTKNGKIINSDQTRITSDWYTACESIWHIARQPPTTQIDNSVKDYLIRTYEKRQGLIAIKSYWHYLAYPQSGAKANYYAATEFVDDFYRWALTANDDQSASHNMIHYIEKYSEILNMGSGLRKGTFG